MAGPHLEAVTTHYPLLHGTRMTLRFVSSRFCVLWVILKLILQIASTVESKDDTGGADGASVGIADECVVCMEAKNTHVFVPCGHIPWYACARRARRV